MRTRAAVNDQWQRVIVERVCAWGGAHAVACEQSTVLCVVVAEQADRCGVQTSLFTTRRRLGLEAIPMLVVDVAGEDGAEEGGSSEGGDRTAASCPAGGAGGLSSVVGRLE